MQITYEDLKTFIVVVQSGSYSKAAQVLSTSRTTIARRINRIEQITANRVVIVNSYHFMITEFGLQFYDSIVNKINSFDQVINEVNARYSHNHEIAGDLRVALPPVLSAYYISAKIPTFLRKYPKLNLAVFYSKNFETDPVRHEIDLMVVNHIPSKQDQKIQKIFSFDVGLFCTRKYQEKYGIPQTLSELNQHIIVGHTREDYKLEKTIKLTNNLNNKIIEVDMPNRLMANSEHNILCFMHSGEAIIPLIMRNEFCLEKDDLVRVLPDYTVKDFLTYYLITNPFSNQLNVQTFATFIKECLST